MENKKTERAKPYVNKDGSFAGYFDSKSIKGNDDLIEVNARPLDGSQIYDFDLGVFKDGDDFLKSYISEYRKEVENAGVEVKGMMIQTDSESRANLLGASQLGVSINWKTENGFVELTNEKLNGIARLVGTHIQKCFNAERVVYEEWDKNPLSSQEDIEKAFNEAYKNN